MAVKRILYVEDNPMNMRLVKRLLTANGYTMLEAGDGLQGIETATREHPDLILMDINLPGIDGMETTSRLKKQGDTAGIPVVALTAVAMKGDRERIMAAGCDEYLQKPIDNALLLETIQRFIGEGEPKPAINVSEPRRSMPPSEGVNNVRLNNVSKFRKEPKPESIADESSKPTVFNPKATNQPDPQGIQ